MLVSVPLFRLLSELKSSPIKCVQASMSARSRSLSDVKPPINFQ